MKLKYFFYLNRNLRFVYLLKIQLQTTKLVRENNDAVELLKAPITNGPIFLYRFYEILSLGILV